MRAPVLVIGIGNPSRGDDALGPIAIDRLAALDLPDVELLTDFQLQVEHALDIEGRREVVFVDATLTGPGTFEFRSVRPIPDTGHTSHALEPEAVLAACDRIGVTRPESVFVLAIRGHHFELGDEPSAVARQNLEMALDFLRRRFTR